MYTDKPERITFTITADIVDQVIDWFGKDIAIQATDEKDKVSISLWASPDAMEHWATQYLNHVQVTAPEHLRQRIKDNLRKALENY
jgi:predicted DNA-binding transcriptional regulator YafY